MAKPNLNAKQTNKRKRQSKPLTAMRMHGEWAPQANPAIWFTYLTRTSGPILLKYLKLCSVMPLS